MGSYQVVQHMLYLYRLT